MRSVLAVGGTDSGGGAGIAADVKALHALGVHASTVVTAVTAQSSTAISDVHGVPAESVQAQLRAVLDDLGADVVKTGMLWAPETVALVADEVRARSLPLVVDPVGVSSTGTSLQGRGTLDALRDVLLPLATVVTPNLDEVRALTGLHVRDRADLLAGARAVHALGPTWVLVTGGHLPGEAVDLLYDGEVALELPAPLLSTPHTHGSGCTLAAALAGALALGDDVPAAARRAKALVTAAIAAGYPLGAGAGPVSARG